MITLLRRVSIIRENTFVLKNPRVPWNIGQRSVEPGERFGGEAAIFALCSSERI
jgi:hypothetical protein